MSQEAHKAYQLGYKQVAHHEWRTAENTAAFLIPHIERLAKEKPNLKLLDIGAGSGTITAGLVKYMPDGQVTAADLSDEILSKARVYAEKAGVKITTQVASVYELERTFGKESFDIVHASQMLPHLDDPVSALRQMVAVCKPGGIVATRDADIKMFAFYPWTAGLKKWHDATLANHQGSIEAGSKLLHWGMAAGVPRGKMTWSSSTWGYSTPQEKYMWSESLISRLENDPSRQTFIDRCGTSEADFTEMIAALRQWQQAEDATFGSLHGELLIRR